MKKLLFCSLILLTASVGQSQSWLIGGNNNINPAIHFLGTTNNQPLKFRINNQYAGEMDSANGKTFFGYGAGKISIGTDNVAIGCKAFNSNTTGTYNTANGSHALFSNTTASGNTANGSYALFSNTTGNQNTANGHGALYLNTTGNFNTANGDQAMYLNTTGYENTATGSLALYSNTTGYNNVANGYAALNSNTTGNFNAANGYEALYLNTTGDRNTASGYQALFSNTTGSFSIANGYQALYSNTTANYNTAIGDQAMFTNTTGYENTATGHRALYANTTGYWNTANGYRALFSNTTGFQNTANGSFALYSNTTGGQNTTTGYHALYSNTTGSGNTANGAEALYSNTTGYSNIATGYVALYLNTTGYHNTAYGNNTLKFNKGGSYNVAIGGFALFGNTNSHYNTAVGYAAGDGFDNGSLNVFVGEESDATAAGLSNIVAVGQGTMVAASNIARFGNSGTTSYGGYANWTNISDGRYKKNIKENVPGLEFINKLRPVTYNLDASGLDAFLHKNNKAELNAEAKKVYENALAEKEKIVNTGFIAQEVEAAAKELGFDFSGVDAPKNENDVYGLRYAEFVVPLVKAVQEQQQLINDLQKRIVELEKKQGANYSSPGNAKDVLNVWPNPSSDNVLVNIIANEKSQAIIKIFDSKGSLVKQKQSAILAGNNQIIIDIKGLATGMYHLSAEWNNGQTKKTVEVIKQ